MIRCAVCGKRIWSDLLSMQDKGDYHYECAKSTGTLLALEADRDKIPKRIEELTKEAHELLEKKASGHDDLGRQICRIGQIQEEMKFLRKQMTCLERLERERRKGV